VTDANVPKIRVLLVDDSRLTRIGIKTTLKAVQQEIELVGEAEDGTQAVAMASTLKPHVILMDIGMPIMDGVRATQNIKNKHSEIKVVMLTSHEDEAAVLDAFSSGANSYCLKETPPEMLVHVIKSTAHGACWIDPKIARIVMSQLQPNDRNSHHNNPSDNPGVCLLTDREVDVLKLVTQGLNNAEIAERLYITMNTVKTHLKNIFQKLEVEDRTAAALKALKERII
jgi:DNA-binding NarL/FixJ family response regulator